MTEELMQFDADLKGLFVESKLDEIMEQLQEQSESLITELAEYNWNIVNKYYGAGSFDLLLQHLKFVAYTCFMVEYAYKIGLITEEAFQNRMMIYNEIYELKRSNA
jgi:hypothetical protein